MSSPTRSEIRKRCRCPRTHPSVTSVGPAGPLDRLERAETLQDRPLRDLINATQGFSGVNVSFSGFVRPIRRLDRDLRAELHRWGERRALWASVYRPAIRLDPDDVSDHVEGGVREATHNGVAAESQILLPSLPLWAASSCLGTVCRGDLRNLTGNTVWAETITNTVPRKPDLPTIFTAREFIASEDLIAKLAVVLGHPSASTLGSDQ